MAAIKHSIGKPNYRKMCVVYLQFFHNQRRAIFTSFIKVEEGQWDFKYGRVKKAHPEAILMNEVLQQQISKVNQFVLQCRLEKEEPTTERIRSLYRASNAKTKEASFFDCFKDYIEDIKASKSKNTISIYNNVISYLKGFEKRSKQDIQWRMIDNSFLEKFASHLYQNNLATATVKRNIAYFKAFLNYASHKGLLNTRGYEMFTIRVPKKEVISLTEAELERIATVKLPEHLAKVRDAFCFTSLTGGLRYSDLKSVGKEIIQVTKSGLILKLTAHKTKTLTTIPLLPQALEILKRRNYQLVSVSHQRYLKLIKKIAQLAKINDTVTIIKYKGANKIETQLPKFAVIGSHTARRTYITLSLQRGIPIQLLASVTHSGNINSLMRYAAIDEDKKIAVFTKAWAKNTKTKRS